MCVIQRDTKELTNMVSKQKGLKRDLQLPFPLCRHAAYLLEGAEYFT